MSNPFHSNAPIQVSIQDWMRAACELPSLNAYVEGAVDLAWTLTKHICRMNQSNLKLEDHITLNDVIVFVERPSLTQSSVGCTHKITDVQFKIEMETPNAIPLLAMLSQNAGGSSSSSSSSSSPQAVCFALGKLFLDIFSQGRSRSLALSGDISCEHLCKTTDSLQHGQNPMQPASKRQTIDVSSSMARDILLQSRMPQSICNLVCDLLSAGDNQSNDTTFTSVKELFWDLTQMKLCPKLFLFENTCPQKALDETGLFSNNNSEQQLFGRDEERMALMSAKDKVLQHVKSRDDSASTQASFLCEIVLIGGVPGSGKSSLLCVLEHACKNDEWLILTCKFDKKVSPHKILAGAFNDFFEKLNQDSSKDTDSNSLMGRSFHKIFKHIFTALDGAGFDQLCDLVPNFGKAFPLLRSRGPKQEQNGISSMDKVGSANERRIQIFRVLFNAVCSVGHPVLVLLDDIQWSDSVVVERLEKFVINDMSNHDETGDAGRNGLYFACAYRSNEVDENDPMLQRINNIQQSGKVHVTMLPVGELCKADVTKLIASKLCLPWRYVQNLSAVVHSKTARGMPYFVTQFLKAIIQNKMLEYSVKLRRWTWDIDVVDLQMISDDVATLLSSTFSKLPSDLMQSIKIVSCLGFQVEEDTIKALNSNHEVLPFDMIIQLELGVKEGILEKAGGVYAFVHDILHQAVYDLIKPDNRTLLHKTIGDTLLENQASNSSLSSSDSLLKAVDQINIYIKDCNTSPSCEECSQYAHANAKAAELVMAAQSFEQAKTYIDVGIQLLEDRHWSTSYDLSLKLFDMSAMLSCMRGDITSMSTCLDQIMIHATSFDDSLNASSLLVKLLASSLKFEEAQANCIVILSNLGEVIPTEVSLIMVQEELSKLQIQLRKIKDHEQIEQLPRMTDRNKINAMKFMNMLCSYSILSKPNYLPLVSCRMVMITQQYGFSDDSIVGLATAGYSVFLFTEDIELAANIGRITELLVEKSPNKHALKSRLCNELIATLKMIKEPWHSVAALYPDAHNSAMLAGDVESACICRWSYSAANFWVAAQGLDHVYKHLVMCIKEMTKYQQNTMILSVMALFNSCIHLMAKSYVGHEFGDGIDLKSPDELDKIAETTKSPFLAWQFFNCRMINLFWMREFMEVAMLSEKHSEKHPSSQQKRILQVLRVFYEGISYLVLARDTKQAKWRQKGEKALMTIMQLENSMSEWNFHNKSKLLQAEYYYLNGDIALAEAAYDESIKSAHDHKYINEESLAYELHGNFCLENSFVEKGVKQLSLAIEKYTEWGAMYKVREVQQLIDLVKSSSSSNKYIRK